MNIHRPGYLLGVALFKAKHRGGRAQGKSRREISRIRWTFCGLLEGLSYQRWLPQHGWLPGWAAGGRSSPEGGEGREGKGSRREWRVSFPCAMSSIRGCLYIMY